MFESCWGFFLFIFKNYSLLENNMICSHVFINVNEGDIQKNRLGSKEGKWKFTIAVLWGRAGPVEGQLERDPHLTKEKTWGSESSQQHNQQTGGQPSPLSHASVWVCVLATTSHQSQKVQRAAGDASYPQLPLLFSYHAKKKKKDITSHIIMQVAMFMILSFFFHFLDLGKIYIT